MELLKSTSAEQFQQCAEFLPFRNRGLGPLAVTVLPIPLAGRAAARNVKPQAYWLDVPFTPTRPPAENTAEKQRVRQQMLARNWHDDAISPELGSFCQKSHLIAGLIDLS